MADFSHLKQHEASQEPVDYPLYEIDGDIALKVVAAGENNKGYFNALLRSQGSSRGRAKISAKTISQETLDSFRDEDKKLYAQHIIKGWENVVDSSGKKVKFSVKEAESFLEQLPNWIFDGIRKFCSDIGNFVDRVDSEDKGKN